MISRFITWLSEKFKSSNKSEMRVSMQEINGQIDYTIGMKNALREKLTALGYDDYIRNNKKSDFHEEELKGMWSGTSWLNCLGKEIDSHMTFDYPPHF